MQIEKGYIFGVYGADSTGEVIDASGGSVSYRFDHSPDTTWGMARKDFAKITFPLTA